MPNHFEAKKHAYRQTQDGVVISFLVHPDEVRADLAAAALGTIYQIAYAEVNPDTGQEQSPQSAGGRARVAALSPERRSEIASNAAKKRWGEMGRAQQAGILCSDPQFQGWLAETYWDGKANPDTIENDAATFVRNHCAVHSRALIDGDSMASQRFDALVNEYRTAMGQMAEQR